MEITLNGKPHEIEPSTSLSNLISNYNLSSKFVAVINGDIIKESDYDSTLLESNSKVDLISIVGGG